MEGASRADERFARTGRERYGGVEDGLMWRDMLEHMPIAILVNIRRNFYNVRNNTLMVVWADDLPEGGYPGLLSGIAGALPAREAAAFRKTLSMQRLKRAYGEGGTIEILSKPRPMRGTSRRIQTRVVFGSGGGGEVFELRMDAIGD